MALTVLIPAYNEQNRIEPFLKEVLAWKAKHPYFKELIIINDGSTDRTAAILERYKNKARIITHERNRGKGATIRTGILAATQQYIVFLDADGATPVHELDKMVAALQKYPIATGTRKSRESKILVKQPLQRRISSWAFNLIANILFNTGSNDVLCGFKGMHAGLAKEIAREMISNGWEFDVEILARAKRKGAKIGIIPIEWSHQEESKMRLGITSLRIFFNLLKIRIAMH